MKKLILLVSILFVSTAAFAQRDFTRGGRGIDWGIKGGLNLATVTKADDSKVKPSIYVGVFAEFQVLDWMGIQPELVYSRQGYKSDTGGIDRWNRLNYLNLPIMVKFYVFDRLSVDVGPQFGVMLNARQRTKIDGNKETHDLDNFKNFDVSFPIGLTYRVLPRLDVSARYNIGLTKVHDDFDGKNGVFQLGVGYRW